MNQTKTKNFIYQYRYLIAGIIFIMLVSFQLNGSSIGIYNSFFENRESAIVGHSLTERSDEFGTFTPLSLSQSYQSLGGYYSNVVRGTKTDVFLEYGQPVKDISIIFRPFQWGYLFLPQGFALSFFWIARLIGLIIVSFEFGMLVFNKRKDLSIMYSLLVTFAPLTQWWFSTNGIAELIIFSQLIIVCLNKYFESTSSLSRSLHLLIMLISCGGFGLVFYPPWQVPLAYIIIGLIIWSFIDNKNKERLTKLDIIILVIEIVLFILLITRIMYKSWDTIQSILSTVYPGKRICTGGRSRSLTLNYFSNILFRFDSNNIARYGGNKCESARFIDMYPICYIPSLILLFKDKTRDKLTIILLSIAAFFNLFIFVGFPKIISTITLMKFVTEVRLIQIWGMLNLIILFRSISLLRARYSRSKSVLFAFLSAMFVTLCNLFLKQLDFSINNNLFNSYNRTKYVEYIFACFLTIFILSYFIFRRFEAKYNLAIISVVIISLFAGVFVNPIRVGVNSVYNIPIIKDIEDISSCDKDALWITSGEHYIENIPIMVKAKTLNSVNIYPNLEFWHKLDPSGSCESIYNRYAHIKIEFDDVDTRIDCLSADSIMVTIRPNVLRTLSVKYIFSQSKLDDRFPDSFKLLKTDNNCYIYEYIQQ